MVMRGEVNSALAAEPDWVAADIVSKEPGGEYVTALSPLKLDVHVRSSLKSA